MNPKVSVSHEDLSHKDLRLQDQLSTVKLPCCHTVPVSTSANMDKNSSTVSQNNPLLL